MPEHDVDENGRPEGPAEQAVEKRKHRNLTYAALGLAGVGVAITVYLAKRGSSGGASSYQYPQLGPSMTTGGGLAGGGSPSGGDTSSQDAAYQALANQLQANETANLAAQQGFTSALNRLAAELHAGSGGAPSPGSNYLPPVNAGAFARMLPGSSTMDILGTETAHGYQGEQLRGGAPLYALIHGQWIQGLAPSRAPVGTIFATTPTFARYAVPPQVHALAAPSRPSGW